MTVSGIRSQTTFSFPLPVTGIALAILASLPSVLYRGTTASAGHLPAAVTRCSGVAGWLSEWGKDCWLLYIPFRISWEMRALGFPAALVFSGTMQQEWGWGEVCNVKC